jgi:ubiquinone/menaquinone biosynthesis C-methylase UbiE
MSTMNPSAHAATQYASSTDKLTTRIAIYSYSTNTQSWFSWLSERLPLTGSILEVGAGTGALWKHVDNIALNLILTDFSPAMCAQLRLIPGAIVKECNAQDLPFEDEKFDVVVASHMLYHLDNPSQALSEFSRVLKPGGRVFASLGSAVNNKELKELGQTIGQPSVMAETTRITTETAVEYLERSGFGDVSEEIYPGNLEVPAAEPVLAYLGSLAEGGMSGEQEAKARGIIEEKIREKGCFRITKEVVLFTARKK